MVRALRRAAIAKSRCSRSPVAQPTTRLANRSITTARYSQPSGPDIGDVGAPLLVWPGCREVLIEQVRRDRPSMMAVRGPLEPPLLPSLQTVVAHQPGDPAATDHQAGVLQFPRHP